MSETKAFRLDALGQPLCRMAQALFAPAAAPACPPTLPTLQTDPAMQMSALFLPLTHSTRRPVNVVPQPPESAMEPRPDVKPAVSVDWQAKNNSASSEPMNRVADLQASGRATMGHAQTGQTPTSDALYPSGVYNAPQHAPKFPPGMPIMSSTATFGRLSSGLLPPTLPTLPVEAGIASNNAAKTTQAKTTQTVSPAVPDVLHALRALTTTARTTALPFAGQNHHSPDLQTLSANPFVPLEAAVTYMPESALFPSLNGGNDVANNVSRETQIPFRENFAPGTNGLMQARQAYTEYANTGQTHAEQANGRWGEPLETTPPMETTPQRGNETTPLRLTRDPVPLAAMLQTLVQPALSTNTEGLTPRYAAPFTSPGTVLSERQAAHTLPAFVPTFEELPNNAPPPAAPPDIDALIQAFEEHLELEFRRAYGTSGR